MADLEELGYILQPHTSAGRIPSDKGYRLYVDMLMEEKEQELNEMQEQMLEKADKMEQSSEAGGKGSREQHQLCYNGFDSHEQSLIRLSLFSFHRWMKSRLLQ